jgi:hypothetical protein
MPRISIPQNRENGRMPILARCENRKSVRKMKMEKDDYWDDQRTTSNHLLTLRSQGVGTQGDNVWL